MLGVASAQILNDEPLVSLVDQKLASHFKKRHMSVVPSMKKVKRSPLSNRSIDHLEKEKMDKMMKVFGTRS